jgi:DNA-binding Xre family transcriptional regulator
MQKQVDKGLTKGVMKDQQRVDKVNVSKDAAANSLSDNQAESTALKALMQNANISSYRALATQSGVSRWQVQQLRSGHIDQMRLAVLAQLAAALQISVTGLIANLGRESGIDASFNPSAPASSSDSQRMLQQEYQRLQQQMAQQVAMARSQVQIEALQTLENWLTQWPTIAKRAIENPELSAAKFLPFIRPVEQLMAEWGVVAIAAVDDEIPYNPQLHQLLGGMAETGELVKVTHSGSQYQGKLLHRAKVKPLNSNLI